MWSYKPIDDLEQYEEENLGELLGMRPIEYRTSQKTLRLRLDDFYKDRDWLFL